MNSPSRITTGVSGLDHILQGGLVAGGSYILQGRPGAGKTVLANQIAFHRTSSGEQVLYVTLLAEAHEHLFSLLSTLSFFDRSKIGAGIDYLSAFREMKEEGLRAVVDVLRRELIRKKPTLFILDGLLNAREQAETTLDIKTFVAELQGNAGFGGCTTLFLTSARLQDQSPEHTMVDGVIDLKDEVFGARAVRMLEVRKSRGSASLRGLHQFEITNAGVVIHPRIEAGPVRRPESPSLFTSRISTGVSDLDARIGGGLASSSLTLIVGPSGSGKTSLGLNFLAQANEATPALHFGFYEGPERLKIKARSMGLDLEGPLSSGALQIVWQPLAENLLDALGAKLLRHVREQGTKCLFIDGLGAFKRAAIVPQRIVEFFAAIASELQALGVTTLATWEMQELFGEGLHTPAPEISAIVENILLIRFAEYRSRMRRVFTVLKLRDSDFDPCPKELLIGPSGMKLAPILGEAKDSTEGGVQSVAHKQP